MLPLLKRSLLLLSTVPCIWAASVRAEDNGSATTLERRFREANRAYSENDFEGAAKGYRELLKLTGPNAGLYYNLGCATLKAGHLGRAVLNFKRAARLSPRDPDIRANLRFVTALTRPAGAEEENSRGFLTDLFTRWVYLLSVREAGILQLIFLVWVAVGVTVAALGYRGVLRKAVIGWSVAGLVLLAANSLVLGMHIYSLRYGSQAVVVEDGAQARSGPGEDNTRVLVLPEGTLVALRESRGGWVLVSLPSGRSGWLPGEMVEKI